MLRAGSKTSVIDITEHPRRVKIVLSVKGRAHLFHALKSRAVAGVFTLI